MSDFKFAPIEGKAVNSKKQELNFHVINLTGMIGFGKKAIHGQVQSYKSKFIEDSIGDEGLANKQNTANFVFEFETYDKLDEQLQKYVSDNIEKIVANS